MSARPASLRLGLPMTNSSNLRLMAILAHPDDESMAIGGTLARYAAEGVDVTLITATRGQRGWPVPQPTILARTRSVDAAKANCARRRASSA